MTFNSSTGCLHMHTFHSDGTGSVRDLARAAREAGLEWIWITDHDSLGGKPEEGIIDGVVVLVGYEITPARNHFLVGDVPELISRDLPPAEYVAEVARRGGVGIVAHPDERAVNQYTESYRWDDWTQRGFTGIELWNYMSDWVEHYTPRSKFLNFFFPARALRGPTPDTLAWWDALQDEGARPTGVCGVDAHATKVRSMGREWEVYSYAHCFRRLVNFLQLDAPLSKDFQEAERQIWDAIRRGRVLMANQGRGDATGATFIAQSSDDPTLRTAGDALPLGAGVALDFAVPHTADLRLLHNGTIIASAPKSRTLHLEVTDPGHYRAEAWRGGGLWVMTNPVHVGV